MWSQTLFHQGEQCFGDDNDLKVFASNIETMLTNMTRIKDMGGRFLSNYWLEDNPGAERVILSQDEIAIDPEIKKRFGKDVET